jgi:hypothetical protein
MKVQNMQSSNGNNIANQFLLTDGNKEIFQSYDTIIAINEGGKITLDEKMWDCSTTTGKYRNQFLGEGIAKTRAKIKAGVYTLKELN